MEDLIDYHQFPDVESALKMATILEKNNVYYEIDDSALRFALNQSNSPSDRQVILRIKSSDVEKANSLIWSDNSNGDHFLYTFQDSDLVDVIANPEDWSPEEQEIARRIIRERNLRFTPDEIQSSRYARNKEKDQQQKEAGYLSNKNAGWFLIIGVLSIVNTFIFFNGWMAQFIFGLGITQAIDVTLYQIAGQYEWISLLISCLFSSIFIWLWYFARKGNKGAFLTGIIIYALDMGLCLYLQQWSFAVFHMCVLCFLTYGYWKLLRNV